VMVSLGLWDTIDYVGSIFVQASTTMHELGHNIELYHGGSAPIYGNATTATYIEPNCKPNYLSIMSYLFQARGLFDNVPAHAGIPQLNYSTLGPNQPNQIATINENAMSPVTLGTLPYRTAWFEPLVPGTTAYNLGLPAAKKYCNGEFFPDGSTVPPNGVAMARTDAQTVSSPLGWNAASTDINLDGLFSGSLATPRLLPGFDDWSHTLIRLGGRLSLHESSRFLHVKTQRGVE